MRPLGVSEADCVNAALQHALGQRLVEFPGGVLSVGAGEPSSDGVIDGERGDGGEGFAVEKVEGPCEVEVVVCLAACDVDVDLGSGGGGSIRLVETARVAPWTA